ncbi:hypothetical protein CA54_24700 [Symmachiella macrocystis]|uniref:Uncharacterized protein n=1 Tax=Symmachiella macrocystis TaxID=2527985 RepID=A0A5C6BNN6_9PLAN|nr:hypothetical protein [Symmachiella macrocystis]TWU13635.1 hypothetical protein CA54_24700 [Symmachiella macrocystis]
MKRRFLIVITLLAVMACPLLVGPYAWLDYNSHLSDGIRTAVDPAYAFLETEAGRFEVTDRLFFSYLALWLGGEFEAVMYQVDRVDLSHLP